MVSFVNKVVFVLYNSLCCHVISCKHLEVLCSADSFYASMSHILELPHQKPSGSAVNTSILLQFDINTVSTGGMNVFFLVQICHTKHFIFSFVAVDSGLP